MLALANPKAPAMSQTGSPVTGRRAAVALGTHSATTALPNTAWNFASVALHPSTATILRKRVHGGELPSASQGRASGSIAAAVERPADSSPGAMPDMPSRAAISVASLPARHHSGWNFAHVALHPPAVALHPPMRERQRDRVEADGSAATTTGFSLSSPTDALEQDADARAETVLRALSHRAHAEADVAARHVAAANVAAEAPRATPRPLPTAPHQAEPILAAKFGSGRPLDPHLRARVEPLVGHDLASVRVYPHEADSLATAWQARAFTVGHSVFFRAREWQPETHDGMGLLLHELIHTTQPADARTIQRKASVADWEFHNQDGGTTASDNCCALCPANLGVDSHGYGPGSFTNGMELKAFLNDEPGTSYDVKRVRETAAFAMTGGTWTRFLHEGPNKPDDSTNDDECLTPQVTVPYLPYVFSIDYPGFKTTGPLAGSSAAVYESNFIESVAITANGATTVDPKTFDWHAIVWITNASGGGWLLDKTRSEIQPGHTTLGTKSP